MRCLLLPVLASLLGLASPASAGDGDKIAFLNVDVVDVASGQIIDGRTVLVEDGLIASIGDKDTALPPDARRIDATGKFLAPGLADMHTHTWYEDVQLPLDLAFGVTTIREMWGTQSTLDARKKIESGEMLGPRIVTAGAIVDGDPPIWPGSAVLADPLKARELVAEQKAAGYDFIKTYDELSPEAFAALVEAAREAGMPIAGHIPLAVPIADAAKAGMKSFEHIGAKYESEILRPEIDRKMMNWRSERFDLGAQLLAGTLSLDAIYDWDKVRSFARTMVAAGVAATPTLAVDFGFLQTASEKEARLQRPSSRFSSEKMRANWREDRWMKELGWDDITIARLAAFLAGTQRIAAILYEEGVLILAGTDTGNPFMVHGYSIHEELEELRDAGLGNLGAIRAATINPAKFLGEEGQWGEVRLGARADLVLLAANPLDDVSNYYRIDGVVARGHWLDASEIARMREDGRKAYAAIPPDPPAEEAPKEEAKD
ncbi:amidohydrolase family protein [Qipengyuania soli]|uniref:Amidohydrolase family protein n=1 Tax=Qipengyuania soli TaxID=2782568 RepID=A0A7S8ITY9_9SPHN|nr:amidohydrolase family protein [Qipengyuania soli]QPC97907.1 amidohydrolase family protein [Qipengyuania soli]